MKAKRIIYWTSLMRDGAWKGRVDQEDLDSLSAVCEGTATKMDLEIVEQFFTEEDMAKLIKETKK